MNEHTPQGDGQHRVEVGIDGKPFDVWEPGPQFVPPAERAPVATDWVGGSYYPRGPSETAMLETPRNSMEFNHYAWYSLGLGGAPLLIAALAWSTHSGGLPWIVGLVMAGTGAYYGLRSHNAGVRGFCTNGRLGLAGLVVSILGGLATVSLILRVFVGIATIATHTAN